MPYQQGSEAGGKKLQVIRQRQGMTQFDLSEAITQANYSKIERGMVLPSRTTLEAILNALKANFNERQEAFTAFGYLPSYPLPEPHEIEAAIARCQPILDGTRVPAYLTDFLTRLLAWNNTFSYLPGVLGTNGVLDELRYVPLFKAQFDNIRLRLGKHVKDSEKRLLTAMRRIRYNILSPYQGEHWYADFVAELCKEPVFNQYWQATENTRPRRETNRELAVQGLEPLLLKLPGFDTKLYFYVKREALAGDERFRTVYLIPADGFTMRQVERWLAEKHE